MLLRPEGFMLFTDHKNLVFIFNPLNVNPTLSKHVVNKIERWALSLSAFRYSISHVPGDQNLWADLLSRWGAKDNYEKPDYSINALFEAPISPDRDPDFTWPTIEEIINVQQEATKAEKIPEGLSLKSGALVTSTEAIWLPSTAEDLQLRICIIGHCGRGGHRGAETTFRNIQKHFIWNTMKTDIITFCNTCLHCQATIGGKRIPRPLSHALHTDTPNELIHFDFLYMGESVTGQTYVMIIKDDASSFVWLEPCASADAQTTWTL